MASQENLPSRPRITQNQTAIPDGPSPSQHWCLRSKKRKRLYILKSFGRSSFNIPFPASSRIPNYYTISTARPSSTEERGKNVTSECRAINPVWPIAAVVKVQIAAFNNSDIRAGYKNKCINRKDCPNFHAEIFEFMPWIRSRLRVQYGAGLRQPSRCCAGPAGGGAQAGPILTRDCRSVRFGPSPGPGRFCPALHRDRRRARRNAGTPGGRRSDPARAGRGLAHHRGHARPRMIRGPGRT
jgi:hypothetical protein